MKRQRHFTYKNQPFKKPRTIIDRKRVVPVSSLGIEKKFFDSDITSVAAINTGTIFNSLCLVPQGTTDQTRVGNKITIRNINLKCFAGLDDQGTAVFATGNLRVILFVDKQTNGATAAVTDILKTASISSFRNMDQVDRFQILKDKVYNLPCRSANALHTDQGTRQWTMSAKCNIPVHFSSTTGAITELRSNNVGILYISDISLVNAASPGTARIKFTDD